MNQSKSMSAPKAGARSSFQNWATQQNQLFSKLLEQPVTNRQVLLIYHCILAFCSFIFLSGHLITAAIAMVWFVASLYSARKGGLK